VLLSCRPTLSLTMRRCFLDDLYQTYIGPVLISVNPFKQLQIYTEKEVNIYQGSVRVSSFYRPLENAGLENSGPKNNERENVLQFPCSIVFAPVILIPVQDFPAFMHCLEYHIPVLHFVAPFTICVKYAVSQKMCKTIVVKQTVIHTYNFTK